MEDRGSPAGRGLPGEQAASPRVILGVTGSIAAYKAVELVRLLRKDGAEVQVLMTPDAGRFVAPMTFGTVSGRRVLVEIFPENEEGTWTRHVQLGLWADLFVVAPATATTLAKLASGICDSMLTATALSRRCPLLICPAMDHDMWRHPATQRNLVTLRQDGADVLEPERGELASGLVGEGRLPEPDAILARIQVHLGRASRGSQLAGKTVLVTAGPTREAIDPVRFLSNGSTGTMGFALAREAAARGARVVMVAGPSDLATPAGVQRIDVTSAEQMYAAAMEHSGADLVIAAAAVSDYMPAEYSRHKMKKREDDLVLRLRRTQDIVAAIAAQKRLGQTIVGFALETQDPMTSAQQKLDQKKLDWIVLNRADVPGSGFGRESNAVTILSRDGRVVALPQMRKDRIAEEILNCVEDGQETEEHS